MAARPSRQPLQTKATGTVMDDEVAELFNEACRDTGRYCCATAPKHFEFMCEPLPEVL